MGRGGGSGSRRFPDFLGICTWKRGENAGEREKKKVENREYPLNSIEAALRVAPGQGIAYLYVEMKDISYTKTEAFFSTKYIFCAATLGLTKDGRYAWGPYPIGWRAWLSRPRPTQENLRKLPLWCMAAKASFWWAWDEKGPKVWWGRRMSGDDAIAPMQKTELKKREEKKRHEVSLTQRRKAERRKNPGGESSDII